MASTCFGSDRDQIAPGMATHATIFALLSHRPQQPQGQLSFISPWWPKSRGASFMISFPPPLAAGGGSGAVSSVGSSRWSLAPPSTRQPPAFPCPFGHRFLVPPQAGPLCPLPSQSPQSAISVSKSKLYFINS